MAGRVLWLGLDDHEADDDLVSVENAAIGRNVPQQYPVYIDVAFPMAGRVGDIHGNAPDQDIDRPGRRGEGDHFRCPWGDPVNRGGEERGAESSHREDDEGVFLA